MSEGISFTTVWGDCPQSIQAEAREFWLKHRLVPPGAELEARKRQLCVAAHKDAVLVGISTIYLDAYIAPDCRFGFFRCAVDPSYRKQHIATSLLLESLECLDAWSRANPKERVMGVAVIVQNPQIKQAKDHLPVWPRSGLTLIGYDKAGDQIRIKWFDHAEL